MSDEPRDASPDTATREYSEREGGEDLPPIVIELPDHEELSWELDQKLREMKRIVEALDAKAAALNAAAADIQSSLRGLTNMIRTPSGVFVGNLVQDTQRMVKLLHDEEFGPPLG